MKITKIVLATANPHKVEEVNFISKPFGIEFVLPDYEKGEFNPIEDGDNFEQNALIKAKAAWEISKTCTLADDSGLCVEALDGAPGLYSARYAGLNSTQSDKIQKLLEEMKDIPEGKRGAKFVSAMVLLAPSGEILCSLQGECKGKIALEPKGEHGFGYDPIFIIDGTNLTMAEISEEEKNKISHRANALNQVISYIRATF